jgi:nucleotide sugar dehydrogenase
VVNEINLGKTFFEDEPGLAEILRNVTSAGNLSATLEHREALSSADVIIVCVPTPVDESKNPDYSTIFQVSHNVGKYLKRGALVIIESTVGPGIIEGQIREILEKESGIKAGIDFGLAACPERADPGKIMENMSKIPRIVGGIDNSSSLATENLYKRALGVKVIKVSNPKTANAVKLTENLFRDVNIALANEFALLYEKLGIDALEVIDACSTKYNFIPHYPGAGVGGPCLPSNPYYLINEGVKVGNIPYLIRLAREINDRMPDHVISLVAEALNDASRTIKGSRISILGISYKADVKDFQLSPVEKIIHRLKEMGAKISIYDPYFVDQEIYGIQLSKNLDDAVSGTDCIIIGAAHKSFRELDLNSLHSSSGKDVALVDTRNVIDPAAAKKLDFIYRGVGRPKT